MAKLQIRKDVKYPKLGVSIDAEGVSYTNDQGEVARSKKKKPKESFDEAVKFVDAKKTLMAKGGRVRGDGCAKRGKTKGRML